jgi:hypothetical protein
MVCIAGTLPDKGCVDMLESLARSRQAMLFTGGVSHSNRLPETAVSLAAGIAMVTVL